MGLEKFAKKAVKGGGKLLGIGGSAKDAWGNLGNEFDVEKNDTMMGRVVKPFRNAASDLGDFSENIGERVQMKEGLMPKAPEFPTATKDPRFEAELDAENARKRARRLGRAMLITSQRQGSDRLGL